LYSSEVLRVHLGVMLPPLALVIHRVLQTVPMFVICGVPARHVVPRAPVLVQVLESRQVPIFGGVTARDHIPITVVHSRPLQQPYTPQLSSVVAYVVRSVSTYVVRSSTKKSNDSLVGQRQGFRTRRHGSPARLRIRRKISCMNKMYSSL